MRRRLAPERHSNRDFFLTRNRTSEKKISDVCTCESAAPTDCTEQHEKCGAIVARDVSVHRRGIEDYVCV
jgi:hypothetical protein